MLIWNYWPGEEGGAERQCRKLTHALAALGVECTVVTHWPGPGFPRTETDGGSRIVRLGLMSPVAAMAGKAREWGKRFVRRLSPEDHGGVPDLEDDAQPRKFHFMLPFMFIERLSFIASALIYFRANRDAFDIIYAHESHWIAGLGVKIGELLNVPALMKESSYPVLMPVTYDAPFRNTWSRLRMRAACIAQTDDAARDLAKNGIAPDRIFVVPNGVEIPMLTGKPARDMNGAASVVNVLYAGNFGQGDAWKGFSALLRAWQLVHFRLPDARLLVAGSGNKTPWVCFAGELGISSSVSFLGRMRDMDACYQQARIFVLPSYREGMSNALLEAQAWGIPAVVSDIPGNRAIVEEGVNGLLFPAGNHEAFASAVLKLLTDDGLRERMGGKARETAMRKFSIATVSERLINVYDSLCGPRSRRADEGCHAAFGGHGDNRSGDEKKT